MRVAIGKWKQEVTFESPRLRNDLIANDDGPTPSNCV